MTKTPTAKEKAEAERQKRLAEALRQNLKKRKSQPKKEKEG